MAEPRCGTDWFIALRNPILNRVAVDDTLDGVAVNYVATHNDSPYLTGALAWGANGRPGQWSAKITLPATPGKFKVVVNVQAIVDGDPVDGSAQASLAVY